MLPASRGASGRGVLAGVTSPRPPGDRRGSRPRSPSPLPLGPRGASRGCWGPHRPRSRSTQRAHTHHRCRLRLREPRRKRRTWASGEDR